MVTPALAPGIGDIIKLNLDPRVGHEQGGYRPVLVLTPKKYYLKTGRVVMCPITSKARGYVFEIPVNISRIKGVVMIDQIRAVDLKARKFVFVAEMPKDIVSDVLEKLGLLLGIRQIR